MNNKIRQDFPLYDKEPNTIYFDSSCVSMKPRQVLEMMRQYYEEYPSCAGRSNHRLGERVTNEQEQARKQIKKFFHAKKGDIIFTRNTTEAINLVSNTTKNTGGIVLSTDKEHNSNLVPWLKQGLTRETIATRNGEISLEELQEALKKHQPTLLAIHQTSNLDGLTIPLREVTKLAHEEGVPVLVDGAQSAGHMPVDLKRLGVDYYAASGHKMLGPSGTGILYGTEEALEALQPYNVGGDTVKESWQHKYELEDIPHKFEAGLQNYAGNIGFGAAVKYLESVGVGRIEKHCNELKEQLVSGLQDLPVEIIGNPELPGAIVTIIPQNMDAHELNRLLNSKKILTRSGTFCVHSWFNTHEKKIAVRFSSHVYNTQKEVENILNYLSEIKEIL